MKDKYIEDLIEIFNYYNDLKRSDKTNYTEVLKKFELIEIALQKGFENKNIFELLSIFQLPSFKEEFLEYLDDENNKENSEEYEYIFSIINLFSLPMSQKLNLKLSDDNISSLFKSKIIKKLFSYLNSLKEELNEVYLSYEVLNNYIPFIIEKLKKCKGEPISKEIIEKIDVVLDSLDYEMSPNDKMKVQMLIMKYNSSVFENTFESKKNNNSTTLTKEKLKKLFLDFGYDFSLISEYEEQILACCDYDELEKILAFFREKGLQIDSSNINIIMYSTYSNIINVYKVVDKSKEALIEIMNKTPSAFISIRNEDKEESILNKIGRKKYFGSHEYFISNVKFLQELGFDFATYYSDYPTVYTMSSIKLSKNVSDLEKYGFDLKNINKSTFKLSCLKSSSILDTIDQAVELECLNYFLSNTSKLILGPSSLIFYRLYYVKHYNEEHKDNPITIYSSKNPRRTMLTSVITSTANNELNVNNSNKITATGTIKPTITQIDSDIALFLQKHDIYIDEDIINDPLIKELDSSVLDSEKNYVYNFSGKCISRFKVLRIYSAIKEKFPISHKELLLYAICYNSIINDEEFLFIKNTIDKIKEKKEGVVL